MRSRRREVGSNFGKRGCLAAGEGEGQGGFDDPGCCAGADRRAPFAALQPAPYARQSQLAREQFVIGKALPRGTRRLDVLCRPRSMNQGESLVEIRAIRGE